MRALGTFSHETKSGNLVICGNEGLENPPSIYSYANTKKKRVGKIRDVIGPKSGPYIIIKPEKKLSKADLFSLNGETFYEVSRRKNAGKRRNSNRKKSRVY